jgi:hypothetical protein
LAWLDKQNFSGRRKTLIDAIQQSLEIINRWEIPLRTVSESSGVPISELWAYFQRKKSCPNDRALHIADTTRALDAFARTVSPIPVAWKKPLKQIIQKFNTGELRIVVTEGGEEVDGKLTVGDLVE